MAPAKKPPARRPARAAAAAPRKKKAAPRAKPARRSGPRPLPLPAAPALDALQIEARILALLESHREEERLLEALKALHGEQGDAVYPPLLYIFSHLRFSKAEAALHFSRILAHKKAMGRKLGRPVDLRTSLLDYFLSRDRRIEQPKIIELWAFQRTLQSAVTDELTGLYNYRFGREALSREIKRAERHHEPLCVFLFDLDDFKKLNDRWGHLFGNEVLVEVAGMIRRALRDSDLAVRFGGEEFLVVLPGTAKAGALTLAERLRQQLAQHEFTPDGKSAVRVTLSGGVACFPSDGHDASALIKRADQALYTVKTAEKNGVALFSREQRAFARVGASVLGWYRMVGEEEKPLETVNLSAGGILFQSAVRLPAGALLEMGLNLPEQPHPVPVKTRVIRSVERGGGFETAVTIQQVKPQMQARLSEFLIRRMQ